MKVPEGLLPRCSPMAPRRQGRESQASIQSLRPGLPPHSRVLSLPLCKTEMSVLSLQVCGAVQMRS